MEQQMLKEILHAVKENKQEIKNVETRLQKEIKNLREEMTGRIDDVVIEMNDEMDRRFTKFAKEIAIEIRSMGEIIYKKIEEERSKTILQIRDKFNPEIDKNQRKHKIYETQILDLQKTTERLEKKLA